MLSIIITKVPQLSDQDWRLVGSSSHQDLIIIITGNRFEFLTKLDEFGSINIVRIL